MPDSPNVSESNAPVLLEDYLTLSEAAKRLPRMNGKRVNTSTLWRWCRRGVRGVYLEYSKIGRTIVVRMTDLHRFFSELAKADKVNEPPKAVTRKRRSQRHVNSTVRQHEIDAANEVLIKAGIMKSTEVKGMAVKKTGGGR